MPADAEEGVHWFGLAARQGDPLAQYNLGGMYLEGMGVTQDYARAAHWFGAAAAQDHKLAQLYTGALYSEGKGVEPDLVEALKWTVLAGTPPTDPNISARSIALRSALLPLMSGAQVAEAERRAREWRPERQPL